MNSSANLRRRRPDNSILNRVKPKAPSKHIVEDIYPVDVPNTEHFSPEIKHYINELEREYISRYNTLISNRVIYEELIQNISTELDSRGISTKELAQLYQLQIYKSLNKQNCF